MNNCIERITMHRFFLIPYLTNIHELTIKQYFSSIYLTSVQWSVLFVLASLVSLMITISILIYGLVTKKEQSKATKAFLTVTFVISTLFDVLFPIFTKPIIYNAWTTIAFVLTFLPTIVLIGSTTGFFLSILLFERMKERVKKLISSTSIIKSIIIPLVWIHGMFI